MPVGQPVSDDFIREELEKRGWAPFSGAVWRVARQGRRPLDGSASDGRWTPPGVAVVYTSLAEEGARVEVGIRGLCEPVWPSSWAHESHRLDARTERTIRFDDRSALIPLGVDVTRFEAFEYAETRRIARIAYELGVDSLLVPSARWNCLNLVLFADRLNPDPTLVVRDSRDVDWDDFRRIQAGTLRLPPL